jgi:hypothetical protein
LASELLVDVERPLRLVDADLAVRQGVESVVAARDGRRDALLRLRELEPNAKPVVLAGAPAGCAAIDEE